MGRNFKRAASRASTAASATLVRNVMAETLRIRREGLKRHLVATHPRITPHAGRALAASELERRLAAPLPREVDAGKLLTRLASLQQMKSSVISALLTSSEQVLMASQRARALALAVADMIDFAEACALKDGRLRMYLTVGIRDGQAIIGLGVEGRFAMVARASSSRALMRSRQLVAALDGDLQRGVDSGRMVIGILLPLVAPPRRR